MSSRFSVAVFKATRYPIHFTNSCILPKCLFTWHLISVSHDVKLRWTSFQSSLVCAVLGHQKLFFRFTCHVHMFRFGSEKDCGQIPFLPSLTSLFPFLNLLCFGDTYYRGVMTLSFPSLWSPRDNLTHLVQSPAIAGIHWRTICSR